MDKHYYIVTKQGILDLEELLAKIDTDSATENLHLIRDVMHLQAEGSPSWKFGLVTRDTLTSMSRDTARGFENLFDRQGIEHIFVAEMEQRPTPLYFLLGRGTYMNYVAALGPVKLEAVVQMREDLRMVCADDGLDTGKGRMLYMPLITLTSSKDAVRQARDLFVTLTHDRGHELVAVLEWTGEPLQAAFAC